MTHARCFTAEFEPAIPVSRRRSWRAPVSFDGRLSRDGMGRTLCKIVDLSLHGARIVTYSPLRQGQRIWLTLPELGRRIARVVRVDEFEAGVEFDRPITARDFDHLAES